MNVYLVIMQDETKHLVQERVPEVFLGQFVKDTQATGGKKIISIVLIP